MDVLELQLRVRELEEKVEQLRLSRRVLMWLLEKRRSTLYGWRGKTGSCTGPIAATRAPSGKRTCASWNWSPGCGKYSPRKPHHVN